MAGDVRVNLTSLEPLTQYTYGMGYGWFVKTFKLTGDGAIKSDS